MNNSKQFEQFKNYLNLFDSAIKSENNSHLLELLKLIKNNETLFLESYSKRKKEGVYYTNEEISKFIVSKCIIELINQKYLRNFNTEIKYFEDINQLESTVKQKIVEFLFSLSLCDPACGSGVFLVSAATILFDLIQKVRKRVSPIEIKKCILKNIYGLDINPYAIKLCSLKLFAWLYNDIELNNRKSLISPFTNLKVRNSLFSIEWPNKLFNKRSFDIIIGNPPYGNILSTEEKDILKNENMFYNDIYCSFLIKSLDWIDSGIIGLLVPKSFLLRQGYIKFRNNLLANATILKIYDIGAKLFKKATNEVQIVIYQKSKKNGKSLEVFDYPDYRVITYLNQKFDNLRVCFNQECPLCVKSKQLYVYTYKKNCPFCRSQTVELSRIRIKPSEEIFQLLTKIEKIGDLNYLNPIDFPKMIRGEEEKGLVQVKHKMRKDMGASCYFINARNDFNYYSFKKRKSFNIEELDSKILKGNDYEYYKNPKLLIKHNNIIPEAIYSEDNVCFTSSIYSLLYDDTEELKYLCALINSALIQFYCIYGINNQKDTTINLNQYMIRHLPFININRKAKSEIANKVHKIIEDLKINNGKFDTLTRNKIKQIDDFIFSLYSITDNEKTIILNNLKKQVKYFENIYGE